MVQVVCVCVCVYLAEWMSEAEAAGGETSRLAQIGLQSGRGLTWVPLKVRWKKGAVCWDGGGKSDPPKPPFYFSSCISH